MKGRRRKLTPVQQALGRRLAENRAQACADHKASVKAVRDFARAHGVSVSAVLDLAPIRSAQRRAYDFNRQVREATKQVDFVEGGK